MLTPMGDRILVLVLPPKEMSTGGLFIPTTAQEVPQLAKVVAIGPGKLLPSGSRYPLTVQVGDTLVLSKYTGFEVSLENTSWLLIREEDVLGVYSGN